MRRFRPTILSPRRGFSLLEVLIAVTIFSVCLVALYSTFRVSTRAFEAGRKSSEVLQTMRFAVDRVSRDLRGVYYETEYKARLNGLNWETWAREDAIAQSLDGDQSQLLPGLYSTDEGEGEDKNFAGLMLNLQFKATDHGETDEIEFTRFLPSDGTLDNSYLGAERIRYYVSGTDLYRQRSRVMNRITVNAEWRTDLRAAYEARLTETDEEQRKAQVHIDYRALAQRGTLPEEYQPKNTVNYFVAEPLAVNPPELLAHGVTKFNMRFGYFSGQWQLVEEWDSDAKKYRSPSFGLTPDDSDFLSMLADYQLRPNDNLPAYVSLTLTVDPRVDGNSPASGRSGGAEGGTPGAKPKRPATRVRGRARTVQTIIWIPASLEGYLPEDTQGKYEPKPEEQ